MSQIHGLIRYLNSIETEYGVSVVIKDFVGFLDSEATLFSYFQPFYVHQSAYCMFVKDKRNLWDQCLLTKEKIYKKLTSQPVSFYGVCHAGVGEYIVPILYEATVVGAICVGGFYSEQKKVIGHSATLSEGKKTEVDDQSESYYQASFIKNTLSVHEIEEKVFVVSEYLTLLYKDDIIKRIHRQRDKQSAMSDDFKLKQSYILTHAIAYIKIHYKEDITLEEITKFCHCSRSYFSHQFKSLMGVNLKTYINKIRIEEAKKMLLITADGISAISEKVGFKDSNYFSKVFKDELGHAPSYYRKQVIEDESFS
jgi:AraC-like DNA-binding protein